MQQLCRVGFMMFFFIFIAVTIRNESMADWSAWRGPAQNGTSSDTGLISTWSQDGENLIWKADFIGRSTPIVLNRRVYVIGRVGEEITEQERVACFDAESGGLLWEHRFNVFHSTIPFNRLGWTSLAGDAETGYVYAHTISGIFACFDGDGTIVWSRSLTEEFGRFTGYGGRVVSPVVDEDLVILSFLNTSWGSHAAMRHRYFAFDKRTGEVIWTATPGGRPKDTTYPVAVVAEIGLRRLLIDGNSDGHVYAMDINTGENVWGFLVSQGPLNSSVVVDGTRVYASHNRENTDTTVMGRVVCIDGIGKGDESKSHEVWRVDGIEAGYSSPAFHDGRLYVVDSAANLHCLDGDTGRTHWTHSLGTVGKGSPVVADGKIYVTEVNGHFHILQPGANECTSLDTEQIERNAGRYAEIYGSPAIAYDRIYFATEAGLFCLGKNAHSVAALSGTKPPEALRYGSGGPETDKKTIEAAAVRIVPSELLSTPGETVQFNVHAYGEFGNVLGERIGAWSIEGLNGVIDDDGTLKLEVGDVGAAGTVSVKVGEVSDTARVRVIPELPWHEDFESIEEGKHPPHWVRASGRYRVREMDGNKVLVKPPARRGLHRSNVYIGRPNMSDYTVQVDLMGTKPKRNLPDMGLIANRYTLEMQGNHQRLQVLSWRSDLRMAKSVDFNWGPKVWYTMKMTVELIDDKAVVKGKVWQKDTPEPEGWTITVEDPLPNREGSPGIYGYSPAEIFYDNLRVWEN
ncbi:MAG: PQQ-binding-like beta-propeller repeat protein [Candidatus Poribacteria bacterium]|nr:PQQ-binding-like beta-propeller repeat protein [Candidatus Poribacteria bacterium]